MTVIALLQVLLVQSHLRGNDESTSADPIGSESAGLDFIGDDISQDGDGIPERYLNLDGLPLLPPSAQERARVNQMSTERAQEAQRSKNSRSQQGRLDLPRIRHRYSAWVSS